MDTLWREDPLPVEKPKAQAGCDQCWGPVFVSINGRAWCREHFLEEQWLRLREGRP